MESHSRKIYWHTVSGEIIYGSDRKDVTGLKKIFTKWFLRLAGVKKFFQRYFDLKSDL